MSATDDSGSSPKTARPQAADASPPGFFGRVFRLLGGAEGETEEGSGQPATSTASADSGGSAADAASPIAPPGGEDAATSASPTGNSPASACPVCGSPLPSSGPCGDCGYILAPASSPVSTMPPRANGEMLRDRYRIAEHLGQTNTIQVYLARSLADDRLVVVHEALADHAADRTPASAASAEVSPPPPLAAPPAVEAKPAEPEPGPAEVDASTADAAGPDAAGPDAAGEAAAADTAPGGACSGIEGPRLVTLPAASQEAHESPAAEPAESSPSAGCAVAGSGSEVQQLCGALAREQRILASIDYPTIPKVLDSWREGDRCYLVLEHFGGRSLREAWDDPQTTATQRVDWLIQLCQSLAKIHAQGVLSNAIAPERLRVNERGRLVLPDFTSAIVLPLGDPLGTSTRYTAPELVLEPEAADLRADLYSLGATWYALLMGRELSHEDFATEFTPRLGESPLAEGCPLTFRLLLKTFARDPNCRFPTEEERDKNVLPTVELLRHLLAYRRRIGHLAISLGAQTSVGIVRSANEDNFTAWKMSWKSGDESLEGVLLVLADGMGGAAAGEIASEIAVRFVRESLAPQIGEWAAMLPADRDRSVAAAIDQALRGAHEQVQQYCAEHPQAQGLACTADVVVILGGRATIGHVGDSRVGRIDREGVHWITEDQTLISRLLKLGMITAEEALSHPDRSKLLQAIGGGKQVEPTLYHVDLCRGDRLLCCSDGLTGHVGDARIQEITLGATSAQVAADRLVNEANSCGGSDNITVLVALIG